MQSPPPPPPGGYPPPPAGGYPPPPPPLPGGYPPAPPPGYGYGYAPQVAYGGFWIRVVAYIIDSVILGLVGFAFGVVIAAIALASNPANPQVVADSLRPVSTAISVAINIAYFVGLWTVMGGTLGQRLLKLRVVDASTGQPLTFGKALLRWLGLFVAFLVCFVGVIWVAFDARKQGWADKISGTLVLQG